MSEPEKRAVAEDEYFKVVLEETKTRENLKELL